MTAWPRPSGDGAWRAINGGMEQTAVAIEHRNAKGQFKVGHSGIGGRPKGARSKLGEQFLIDLAASWEKHGPQALERCAQEEPSQYLRVVASLMPKELDLSVSHHVQVEAILADFRGLNLPDPKLKRLMRLVSPKVIDAESDAE
jgi:hypothetical protein